MVFLSLKDELSELPDLIEEHCSTISLILHKFVPQKQNPLQSCLSGVESRSDTYFGSMGIVSSDRLIASRFVRSVLKFVRLYQFPCAQILMLIVWR